MSNDPTATAAEVEHFGAIARHLSGARRRALELVEDCGPVDLPALMACWAANHPDEANRLGDRLPHLATGLLWKLEALDLVTTDDERYAITPAGRVALAA